MLAVVIGHKTRREQQPLDMRLVLSCRQCHRLTMQKYCTLHRLTHSGKGTTAAVQQVYDPQGNKSRVFTFDSSSQLRLPPGVMQEQQAEHGDAKAPPSGDRASLAAVAATVSSGFRAYILPKGYPFSVAPGYQDFVAYQMLSVTLSSAGGVLAMQSMLTAIGGPR